MAEELSKSAKKRMAAKARETKHAEEEAAAAAPAAEAAKPKAAAKAGSAKAKPAAAPAAAKAAATPAGAAKASAKPAAKPAASAAAAAAACAQCGNPLGPDSMFCNKCGAKRSADAAPKASAKAAAKADPKKAAAAPAPAAVADPKAAAKSEAKKAAKAAKAAAAPPPKPVENIMTFSFEDDGTGGWEAADGVSKKKDKQKEKVAKQEEAKVVETKAAKAPEKSAAPKAKSAPKDEAPKVSTGNMSAAQKMIAALEEEATTKAKAMIAQKALEQAAKGRGKGKHKDGEEGEEKVEINPNFVTAQVTVPSEKMGRIIGPKGATLNMITEKTGVDHIDTLGDVCTIVGDPEPVKLCEVAIREIVEKGYMSMAYENFTEESVMVHPEHFPVLIGQKGSIIRKIKEELNVEINIPGNITKDNGKYGKKKYPVQVAGSADGVASAKEVIRDIVAFKHHKITHPDTAHVEMELEEGAYRYIIGPKGSEMRHIQNSFKVEVNIPREGNADTGACMNVLIVGMQDGVDRAKAHIEKLLHDAENKPVKSREDKAADDDRNKGDDEVDPEAAKYLIKAKA